MARPGPDPTPFTRGSYVQNSFMSVHGLDVNVLGLSLTKEFTTLESWNKQSGIRTRI